MARTRLIEPSRAAARRPLVRGATAAALLAALALVAVVGRPQEPLPPLDGGGRYDPAGAYDPFLHLATREFDAPYALVDGVPMVERDGRRLRNPVTTAQHGLIEWTRWRRFADRRARNRALQAAKWLREAQDRRTGAWRYRFSHVLDGSGETLEPGWTSGLAQGQAISLLTRLYRDTRDPRHLATARRALLPLLRPASRGGLRRRRHDGPWFEEYATRRPSLILNGHLFTLLGLHDMADLDARAARLAAGGIAAAPRALPAYDTGRATSWYARTPAYGTVPRGYVPIIRRLLLTLDDVRPHPAFRRYAAAWDGRP